MQPNSHVAGQRTEGRRPQGVPTRAGARPTNIVAHHLSPVDIVVDVDADNKAQAFAEAARRAERRHGAAGRRSTKRSAPARVISRRRSARASRYRMRA